MSLEVKPCVLISQIASHLTPLLYMDAKYKKHGHAEQLCRELSTCHLGLNVIGRTA